MNMAVYRDVLEAVGPFDERLGPGTRFPASEDSDFAFRALLRGYSIVYDASAIVHHRAWRGGELYVPLRWNYGVARGGFYAKHLRRHRAYMLGRLREDVVGHAGALPRLLRSEPRAAAGHVALVAGLLFGVARWLVTTGPDGA
jgi:hypothetical protein